MAKDNKRGTSMFLITALNTTHKDCVQQPARLSHQPSPEKPTQRVVSNKKMKDSSRPGFKLKPLLLVERWMTSVKEATKPCDKSPPAAKYPRSNVQEKATQTSTEPVLCVPPRQAQPTILSPPSFVRSKATLSPRQPQRLAARRTPPPIKQNDTASTHTGKSELIRASKRAYARPPTCSPVAIMPVRGGRFIRAQSVRSRPPVPYLVFETPAGQPAKVDRGTKSQKAPLPTRTPSPVTSCTFSDLGSNTKRDNKVVQIHGMKRRRRDKVAAHRELTEAIAERIKEKRRNEETQTKELQVVKENLPATVSGADDESDGVSKEEKSMGESDRTDEVKVERKFVLQDFLRQLERTREKPSESTPCKPSENSTGAIQRPALVPRRSRGTVFDAKPEVENNKFLEELKMRLRRRMVRESNAYSSEVSSTSECCSIAHPDSSSTARTSVSPTLVGESPPPESTHCQSYENDEKGPRGSNSKVEFETEIIQTAFGLRRVRKIIVPPLSENTPPPSRDARIQMELKSLRAQRKVAGRQIKGLDGMLGTVGEARAVERLI